MSLGFKKRKLSGLSGLELDLTLARLRELRSSVIVEEVLESDPTPDDTFRSKLDDMIATLESRVNDPLSLSFETADDRALERFNITRKGMLYLHPEARLREAIIASRAVGTEKLWSNDNMYKHLSFLASSFPNQNETSSRTVIDTFFFRSIAMVPPTQKLIVMLENRIPAVHPMQSRLDTITGVVDYAAVVAQSAIAKTYIEFPPKLNQHYGGQMTAFLAAETKVDQMPLEEYLPQVLLELVACAKHLGKFHIRGALTTGFKWRFVAMDVNTEGDGAKYWVSESIEWRWKTKRGPTSTERLVEETSDEYDPALIAGILSSWIPASFSEFKEDEWFVPMCDE